MAWQERKAAAARAARAKQAQAPGLTGGAAAQSWAGLTTLPRVRSAGSG